MEKVHRTRYTLEDELEALRLIGAAPPFGGYAYLDATVRIRLFA